MEMLFETIIFEIQNNGKYFYELFYSKKKHTHTHK